MRSTVPRRPNWSRGGGGVGCAGTAQSGISGAAKSGVPRNEPFGRAPVMPALNLHLTKSRLNGASRLCQMFRWNQSGAWRAGVFGYSNAGCEGNKVEPLWMQGG
jgi:hypothetical protein